MSDINNMWDLKERMEALQLEAGQAEKETARLVTNIIMRNRSWFLRALWGDRRDEINRLIQAELYPMLRIERNNEA